MSVDFKKFKPFIKMYAAQNLTPSRHGLYVCPYCGSGSHEKKTGAFNVYENDFFCFSCGYSGDILDLIGQCEGLPSKSDQIKRAEEFVAKNKEAAGFVGEKQNNEEPEVNYEDYFLKMHQRIYDTDYWKQRGLSEEIVNRFSLGYDAEWIPQNAKNKDKIVPTPRLIVPTSPYSYLARDVRPDATTCAKMRVGKVCLFNERALFGSRKNIFIVEGEIDAMSIIEVGGEAVALGSTTGVKRFLTYVENHKPKGNLILAFDTDIAGQNCTREMSEGLTKLSITFRIVDSFLGYHDANEALCKNRKDFIQMINDFEKVCTDKDNKGVSQDYSKTSNLYFLDEFLSRKEKPICVPTGFKQLDEALGGGFREGLCVVGGITSLGKSTIMLQIGDYMAKNDHDLIWVSLEMSRNEITAKSLSRETLKVYNDSGLAKNTIAVLDYSSCDEHSSDEQEVFNKAVEEYKTYANRIFIHCSDERFTVKQVGKIVEDHVKLTGHKPVLIVDYIQLLVSEPEHSRYTEKQNMDFAVMELKRIARNFKIPVVAISSFSRSAYSGQASLNAFKESGGIEYTSDLLIALQFRDMTNIDAEKDKNPREVEVSILKHRNGVAGKKIPFDYYSEFNYFEEV